LEFKRQKESLVREVQAFQEHVEFARELTDNKLKSMQEEIASSREQTDIELTKQKQSLDYEVINYISLLFSELKTLQENINKLKKEEQQLTSRIQRLNNEELEILRLVEEHRRRKQQQEQSIQELQPQLKQQETLNLSEEELRLLAIPVICNDWERNWKVLMRLGLPDKKAYPNT
jgi:hypothetical protein